MKNEKEMKADIKGLNVLFFTLIHPITLIICISTTYIILNAKTDKELWNAVSIGALISIPIIYLLDTLRKKRINRIKAIYSSDDSTINNYENKKNRIAGVIVLVIIIGVISNNIFKSNNTTIEENKKVSSSVESKDNSKEWKKNSKDAFCGQEFKSSRNVKAIDMDVTGVTILSCDGSYTSKQDWGTSKSNEEDYNNTVGRSSGNFANFSGTWEIADSNIPSEIESYFRTGGFKDNEYTIIRYHSNKGKTRYAYIQNSGNVSGLYLGLVTFERDNYEYGTYREEDLDMFSGLTN